MIKYIILHWTAGNYKPCDYDRQHYQMLIDSEGKQFIGKPVGEASSCGGMNSITYNIACCGGLSRTPLTQVQMESMFKHTAQVLKNNKLTVDKVYTHAEIGSMCANGTIVKLLPMNGYLKQNIGKVDLNKIPYNTLGKSIGDFIRNKVQWYYNNLK